ncbi:MAG TPA: hypothetical protein VFH44_00880 [Solirubrobacterales bacterium]|nr:hypothetical protein [Solirubrobacterales bacterium]
MKRRADRARILLLVAAFAALAALAPLAFWLGGVAVGLIIIVAVLALLAFVVARWERAGDVEVLSDSDDVHRILVVAHGDADARRLVSSLEAHERGAGDEVQIVVPALTKPLKRLAGDVDDEIRDAEANAQRLVEAAGASGRVVDGGVGDADPRMAVEDALRVFAANEVLVFPPSEDELGAYRVDGPEETFGRVRLPVTVVADDAPPAAQPER